MIEVELPDGTIAEFPDNMSQEEISNVLRQQYSIQPARQSYLTQIIEGSPKRQAEFQRIEEQVRSGEISVPEYILQGLGEGAGNIQDVAGRAVGDVVGGAYGLLPEQARGYIEQKAAPLGQAVLPYLQQIGDFYSDLKQEYPRTMENVEAVTNIGTLAAPMFARKQQITGGIERSGQAIKQKFLPKPKDLSAEDLKATASQLYKKADEVGGILKPDVTNKFVDDVLSELPQTKMGKAVIGETPVTKLTQRIQNLRNQPMTLQAAQEIDEALGDLAYSNMNAVTGQIDKQGIKFLNIQNKFRDAIENAPESMVVGGKEGFDALKDARKYWGTSLRLADVEKAIAKGLSTEQPQTGIKNAFKTLLNSKKIKQFSPAEVQAIKQAAEKGTLVDILGTMGSRLNPQFMAAGVGVTTMNPLAAGAAYLGQSALSSASRGAATSLQLKKARYVEDLIRQRVGAGDLQRMKLTPEIRLLAKELGLASAAGGTAKEILDELQNMQQIEQNNTQEEQ